ncbi:MAG: hypothetical protein MUO63_14525 [Desulfobulbaceae bacterium]|nr:hypothetical protein [Desulfobulbaceae bacterium]
MLIIRKEQMDIFRTATGGVFEDHLVEHLKRFTPYHSQELGEEGLRRVIRYGMERADNYGFTMRGPSRFYVETMFILGSDFDTDPQYPWAFEVLADQKMRDEVKRADALHSRLMDFIGAAATPEMIHRSMVATRAFLDEVPSDWGVDFKGAMLGLARTVHPEKFDYVGEAQMRVLIEDSEHLGGHFDMGDGAGISLLFCLAYAFGHHYGFDPQFPLISDKIGRTAPAERYNLLLEHSKTYLTRTITSLGMEM